MSFPRGRYPKINVVNGRIVMVKKLQTIGGSKALYLPTEWLIKMKNPDYVTIEFNTDGSGILIRAYD